MLVPFTSSSALTQDLNVSSALFLPPFLSRPQQCNPVLLSSWRRGHQWWRNNRESRGESLQQTHDAWELQGLQQPRPYGGDAGRGGGGCGGGVAGSAVAGNCPAAARVSTRTMPLRPSCLARSSGVRPSCAASAHIAVVCSEGRRVSQARAWQSERLTNHLVAHVQERHGHGRLLGPPLAAGSGRRCGRSRGAGAGRGGGPGQRGQKRNEGVLVARSHGHVQRRRAVLRASRFGLSDSLDSSGDRGARSSNATPNMRAHFGLRAQVGFAVKQPGQRLLRPRQAGKVQRCEAALRADDTQRQPARSTAARARAARCRDRCALPLALSPLLRETLRRSLWIMSWWPPSTARCSAVAPVACAARPRRQEIRRRQLLLPCRHACPGAALHAHRRGVVKVWPQRRMGQHHVGDTRVPGPRGVHEGREPGLRQHTQPGRHHATSREPCGKSGQ